MTAQAGAPASSNRIPPGIGDQFKMFKLPATSRETLSPHELCGHPLLCIFYTAGWAEIAETTRAYEKLSSLGVNVAAFGPDDVETQKKLVAEEKILFPLLSDPGKTIGEAEWAAIFIDRNWRLAKIYHRSDGPIQAEQILADAEKLFPAEEAVHFKNHAPVLLVPRVLDETFRQRLLELWEADNMDSGFMKEVDGKTVGMYDYDHKIRRDHFVKPGPVLAALKDCVGRRLIPEIFKAFNYEATRVEDFRVACYDATRGGYFRPHRDNTTTGTAHRRFAMSLMLNNEYQGGYLRFPEFGPQLYRPAAGDAVVFSCSLLHEATDVTAGRRFVLLTFFYGEREAKIREEASKKSGMNYRA